MATNGRNIRVDCRTTFAGFRVSRTLVNPDVIHFHRLRKSGGCIRETHPRATDRQIQDQMKILVKRLTAFGCLIANLLAAPVVSEPAIRMLSTDMRIVHIPANFALFPLHRIRMEFIPNIRFGFKTHFAAAIFTGVLVPGPREAVVQGTSYFIGWRELINTGVEGFKNINLATVRPGTVNSICRQHPNGGPITQATGHTRIDFYTTICPIGFALGTQAGRGIRLAGRGVSWIVSRIFLIPRRTTVGLCLFNRCYVQYVVLHITVFRISGIALRLFITTSPAVDFVGPLRGIETVAFKLIAPDQRPTAGRFIIVAIGIVITIGVVVTIAVVVAIAVVVTGLVRIIWWGRRRVLVTATAAATGAEQQDQDAQSKYSIARCVHGCTSLL